MYTKHDNKDSTMTSEAARTVATSRSVYIVLLLQLYGLPDTLLWKLQSVQNKDRTNKARRTLTVPLKYIIKAKHNITQSTQRVGNVHKHTQHKRHKYTKIHKANDGVIVLSNLTNRVGLLL